MDEEVSDNETPELVEEVGAPASVVEASKPKAKRKRKRKPAAPKPEIEATPMTVAEFAEKVEELIVTAKAAGVRPFKVLAGSFLKQGFDMLDGLLGGLSGDNQKKRPKE